ncbi:MAG: FHA domain-containing protein [Actinobacteria bacterium]|nr:FHA domain-containing protein [Actinomycetota bacterium]
MTDQLLFLLRLGLLAIVYLTFFRVLRAVWVELRTENRVVVPVPAAAPATNGASTHAGAPPPAASVDDDSEAGSRLVVLTPPAVAGQVFELQTETTIGRASDCAVVIDDARVSKVHARIFERDNRWMVEDLGSTNGTLVNDHLLDHPENVGPGDRIQVGEHVLELA